jgi:hypothetical protein
LPNFKFKSHLLHMNPTYFKEVEQLLRELAHMDDNADNHQQHLQYLLDSVSPEKRIQYLQYLEREHGMRLEMIHMARYESEVGFGPLVSAPDYDYYHYHELPTSTIDATIAKVRHLMQTYVPNRLKQEREALSNILNPHQFEEEEQEKSMLQEVNRLLGNESDTVSTTKSLVNDVDQMQKSKVLKLLGYTSKYLNKVVSDGWLNRPVRRLTDGQWYFDEQDVIKFKIGEKYEEWVREQAAKQFDDKPSETQRGLAARKTPKRPAKRKPPKKAMD